MAAIPLNFPIIVSFITTVFFLLGVHHFITNVEPNGCEMTYMFEYPQYVEVGLPADIQRQYPRYSLFAYGEGSKTGELRRKHFEGIPVLFIPGNSGSHKQGRSLASVALRKSISGRSPVLFDFFLADFNEDLSGLYGGVLEKQTQFVNECIDKILQLYSKRNRKPSSVVLIGHSAGGIIAKGVFTLLNFEASKVRLIITLASPLRSPVVRSDPYFVDYYDKIRKVWSEYSSNVSDVSLVSLGGGERDILVRSDLTKDLSADVNALSSHVPGVWCSTDHLSITWCKQLILTIVRALFDSTDLQTKQISTDKTLRNSIFKYHLVQRSAGKKYDPHIRRHTFESNGRWIENLQRQFSVIEKKGLKVPHFLMLRLFDDPKHEAVVLETVNLNYKDWVYACVADTIKDDSRVCDTGINLSNLTEIIPAGNLRRKMVWLNMKNYLDAGFTHIVAKIGPSSTSFMQLNVDVHKSSDRTITFPVPRFTNFFPSVVIETTADNAIYYRIVLNGFESAWQAYHFKLQPLTCKTPESHDSLALATLTVPWANDTKHFRLRQKEELSGILRLLTPRPRDFSGAPELQLKLDPSCKYKLSIGPDRIAAAGQMVRFYSPLLVAYIVAALILTLRRQIESVDEGKGVPFFHNALAQSTRRYYIIIQTVTIGSKLIGSKYLSTILPRPDMELLHDERLDFLLLPLILYAVANGILYIVGALVYGGIVLGGQTANKCAFKFLGKVVTGFLFTSWTDWILSGLHQLPFILAFFLISLSTATCGGLAMSLAAGFYILKLFHLYDDYLEGLFKLSLGFVARTIKKLVKGRKNESSEETITKEEPEKVEDESSQGGDSEAAAEESAINLEEEKGALVEHAKEEKVGDETEVQDEISTLEQIHFHVTVCLLYLFTAATAVPSTLAWSRSFHESSKLLKDPAWIPGIVLCGAGAVLWQGSVPNPNKKLSLVSSWILFGIAALNITYASLSLYRLSFFSSVAVGYLMVQQFVAKFF